MAQYYTDIADWGNAEGCDQRMARELQAMPADDPQRADLISALVAKVRRSDSLVCKLATNGCTAAIEALGAEGALSESAVIQVYEHVYCRMDSLTNKKRDHNLCLWKGVHHLDDLLSRLRTHVRSQRLYDARYKLVPLVVTLLGPDEAVEMMARWQRESPSGLCAVVEGVEGACACRMPEAYPEVHPDGCDIDTECMLTTYLVRLPDATTLKLLERCYCRKGRAAAAAFVLEHRTHDSRTDRPLDAAHLLRELVRHASAGGDSQQRRRALGFALVSAARLGDGGLVAELRADGAESKLALSAAAYYGWPAVVEALLDDDAHADRTTIWAALCAAAAASAASWRARAGMPDYQAVYAKLRAAHGDDPFASLDGVNEMCKLAQVGQMDGWAYLVHALQKIWDTPAA